LIWSLGTPFSNDFADEFQSFMAKKKKKTNPSRDQDPVVDFELSFSQVESIVRELEQGQLGLGDSLAKYEQGVKHLKQCYAALNNAQRRIEMLTGIDRDGNTSSVPFGDESAFENESTVAPSVESDRIDMAAEEDEDAQDVNAPTIRGSHRNSPPTLFDDE